MSDLTPEIQAELRRLLERATPGPWHAWDRGIGYEVHTEAEHNPIHCVSLNSEFRETFRGTDARLIAAAVNALPALLDAAAERDALAADADKWQRAAKVERVRALAYRRAGLSEDRAHRDECPWCRKDRPSPDAKPDGALP